VTQHTTLQCLTAIAQHHGIQALPERLVQDHDLGNEELSTRQLMKIAESIGLKSSSRQIALKEFVDLKGVFPLIARKRDQRALIVAGAQKTDSGELKLAVLDPAVDASKVTVMSQADFESVWSGEIILTKRQYRLSDVDRPFGLMWFIPEVLKQRDAFRDIAIATLVLNALMLGLPIFTQLVIDKVLVHESYSTLFVLTVGVILVVLFESGFTFLRQYLLLAATNKIDIRLMRRTFSHMLSLPIDFFERHTAGMLVRHMQQTTSIRSFLTGSLFFTLLESVSFFIFLPVLFSYSAMLTAVVLVIALMMAAVIVALINPFNRRLQALYAAESQRQSMLVESIHGIRTIKSMAIEPKQRKIWEQRSADVVMMNFGVGRMSLAAQTVTQLLQRGMTIAVVGLGAAQVIDKEMTVGTLIAFQMLAGRVTGPLVQIVGLVHEIQETGLSVKMLGEVMNHPPERLSSGGLRPPVQGGITFEDVTFRYPGSSLAALDRISLSIAPGQVIGVVGRSGSGKSTLTKLIQSLYPVQEGLIRFDGVDLREIDLAYLRRNIGVVLQENFMFRGTIRENIAMTKPDASFEQIVAAAQAAGADEFIERLPKGYDTLLEESATNLSGGQRQRLAIARAILPLPRILILDEASSALDPESEAIFMRNLSKIAEGKTVIIVSHRLSTLVNADHILFFQRGQILDAARHPELLARCEPYAHLWNQQIGRV
jgi:subfamily B ATP-binding cassette protein HlyB/CyaB